ncbi:hypothetical protein [Sorangium sp. So ce381]|uniref:hypothetical protein n=1 Tax=Sorangium sp. So ce381 TaxID=3133307 RepID=UPI003F5C8CE6
MIDARELSALRTQWDSGDAMRVGWVIYEALPNAARPRLAAELLILSCELLPGVPGEISSVIELAKDPRRWREAHDAFRNIRRLTIELLRDTPDDNVREAVLLVAENAAKVIYNASEELASFDYDCGCWLVGCAHDLAMKAHSPELKERFWCAMETLLGTPTS